MRRDVVALLHAAYWGLYVLLLGLILVMLRSPYGTARPFAGLLHAWPIVTLSVVPNAFAFYVGYGPLFSCCLARRRFARLISLGVTACLGASAFGLYLAYILFGADQPVFGRLSETAALTIWLFAVAAIHMSVALVLRGFVDWYGDIQVKEQLTRKTHDMELALIRARLDPHFLFNTLNNIDVLISRDPATASRYLNQLSDIIRFVLYRAKGHVIALTEELSYIEKYIALERIRTTRASYAVHEVVGDPSGLSIAPMTFIPFIENAFKHTEGLKEDGAIVSRVVIEGTRIMFECTNRCRSAAETAARDGGLGNELIRQWLDLLYRGRHVLEAGDRGGTYAVRLTIESQ